MLNKSILLVDDEEIILNALGRDLEHEGYDITVASNGEEAVARLKDQNYDLVITDLVMTGMDGLQVLEESKKNNPDIGVFILTGYGDMTSAIDALRLGADDYLQKPIDTDEILLRIDRCLKSHEALKKIKVYEEIIPICCVCGKIRDDTGAEPGHGEWLTPDVFIYKKTTADVTHAYCPDCLSESIKE